MTKDSSRREILDRHSKIVGVRAHGLPASQKEGLNARPSRADSLLEAKENAWKFWATMETFHCRIEDVNRAMALLGGSAPGALIGARFSTRSPSPWLKKVLCVALLATGVRMLLV
jgi:hypothetical protein